MKNKIKIFGIIGFTLICASILTAYFTIYYVPVLRIEDILSAYDKEPKCTGLSIIYPLDETIFPPEIISPKFIWKDENIKSDTWLITIKFHDNKELLTFITQTSVWEPTDDMWKQIKDNSVERKAIVTIIGVSRKSPKKILSSAGISIMTSKDEVGAPIFFREVNLPFKLAVTDPAKYIKWRFGPISSKTPPPIVLENLIVCGNCHSFSRDGKILAMEVDAGNDKGSYATAPIEKEIILDKSRIFTWSAFEQIKDEMTFGLLCQVSPDGKYVAGTVKDRALAIYRNDIMFSQLFFLIKGFVAIYDREKKTIKSLPGADDRTYVQTNATWSPDSKSIVFARSRDKAFESESLRNIKTISVPDDEARDFIESGKTFLYDLYRLPFNNGKGGKPEALLGASNNGKSNYFAKYSPDGKWIVFCKAKSFMLLQPDSELYIMPSEGGEPKRMRCNTNRMNSWHSWSPNSRWLVFSSKVNGPYTQLFLTHIDEHGKDSPPVVLDHFTSPNRAANIPEFVNAPSDAIKAIKTAFIDDVSYVRAGDQLLEAGNYDSAVIAFRKALDLNRNNIDAMISLGNTLLKQNKFKEAIDCFNKILEKDPKLSNAYNNIGIAYQNWGKLDESLLNFKKALKLNPKLKTAYLNISIILQLQDKLDEAVFYLKEAVKLDPKFEDAHYNMAIILQMQDKQEEAIFHFKEAVRLDTSFLEAYYKLGLALQKQNKPDEAGGYFNKVIKIKPGSFEAHYQLGLIYEKKGILDKAIFHFKEVLKKDPYSAATYYQLGLIYESQRNFNDAIFYFKKAIQLEPNAAGAYYGLGLIYENQGKFDDAILNLKKAIEINPDFEDAKNKLSKVLTINR